MTTVHDVTSDLNSHLFRSDTTTHDEQTVDPADVALSTQDYSNQDLSLLNHPQDGNAGDHDKAIDIQLQTLEPSSTAIQMLDSDAVGPNGALHVEEVNSSDDSQDWTEGESQEHKRVKVCSTPYASVLMKPFWLRCVVLKTFTGHFTLFFSIIRDIHSPSTRFTSWLVRDGKTKEQPSVLVILTRSQTRLNLLPAPRAI